MTNDLPEDGSTPDQEVPEPALDPSTLTDEQFREICVNTFQELVGRINSVVQAYESVRKGIETLHERVERNDARSERNAADIHEVRTGLTALQSMDLDGVIEAISRLGHS